MLSARELIFVDVERPHGHRGRPHVFEQLAVHLVLHVLGQLVRRAAGQQQLRSEQADALRALRHGKRRIAKQIDVGLDANLHAVGGLQGNACCSVRLPASAAATAGLARARMDRASDGGQPDQFGRRIDRHRAFVAVDENQRARRDPRGRIVQPDDRRHVQRPRQDRRVIGAAAGVGDERLELVPVELRGDRGRQLVGDEHAGRLALAEHVAESGAARREIHAKAADTSARSPLRSRRYGSSTPSKTAPR